MEHDYAYSRVVGFYLVMGETMGEFETLVITAHPNGTYTAHPKDCPEVVVPLIPETDENIRRLHDIAHFEQWRKRLA